MPPRRKQPQSQPQPPPAPSKPPTRSALAKTHNLTAEQETAISEAFHLFSYPAASSAPSSSNKAGKEKTKEIQLLPPSSLRRALVALNAPPASAAELKELLSILVDEPEGGNEDEDEEQQQAIPYERFIAVAALKVQQHSKSKSKSKTTSTGGAGSSKGSRKKTSGRRNRDDYDSASDDNDDDDEYNDNDEGDDEEDEEVSTAYRLFTQNEAGREISLRDLRRIARELREEVSEDVLRDMIREAKGGGDGRGTVGMAEFRGVMGRAGAL